MMLVGAEGIWLACRPEDCLQHAKMNLNCCHPSGRLRPSTHVPLSQHPLGCVTPAPFLRSSDSCRPGCMQQPRTVLMAWLPS